MDFDSLTRALATPSKSRRGFLKGLIAAAIALPLTAKVAEAKTCNGFIQPNGKCCEAPGVPDNKGYCCPFGSVLDPHGNCCPGASIDKFGFCCDGDREIDRGGSCCDQNLIDEYGYCNNNLTVGN